MRSVAHCQQLLECFRKIDKEKVEVKQPKRGYGYLDLNKPNTLAVGSTVSNDFGHIPGLRGGARLKYPDTGRDGLLSPPEKAPRKYAPMGSVRTSTQHKRLSI